MNGAERRTDIRLINSGQHLVASTHNDLITISAWRVKARIREPTSLAPSGSGWNSISSSFHTAINKGWAAQLDFLFSLTWEVWSSQDTHLLLLPRLPPVLWGHHPCWSKASKGQGGDTWCCLWADIRWLTSQVPSQVQAHSAHHRAINREMRCWGKRWQLLSGKSETEKMVD